MIAFTDGQALIVVIPSNSSNGVYFIRVESVDHELLISHDCPASLFKGRCRHITSAVEAYERWQWWEPKKEVVLLPQRIILRPEWEQVELPLSPTELIRELIGNVS